MMIPRQSLQTLRQRLLEAPAVVLLGPRQVGKTTLALALAQQWPGDTAYRTFRAGKPFMEIAEKVMARRLPVETYVPGHGPLMVHKDMLDAMEYLHFIQGRAKDSYKAGRTVHEAFDDLLLNLGAYSKYTGLEGLFFTTRMMYNEFAGDTQDHARKNYPDYLATQWKLKSSLRSRYPQLFSN